MHSWTQLARTTIPNSSDELQLWQRGEEFAIRIGGVPGDLMNSRMHASEDALAELACARIGNLAQARVLVGGLGMGFTLAAALGVLMPSAKLCVAELIAEVVDWNRGPLGACAGHPLNDPRCEVHTGDVAELLAGSGRYDAILLDVDNGPEAMTHADNQWLYSAAGLRAIFKSLRADGIVAIWSARQNPQFGKRLQRTGFRLDTRSVRARPGKGSRHTIFLAQKPARGAKD